MPDVTAPASLVSVSSLCNHGGIFLLSFSWFLAKLTAVFVLLHLTKLDLTHKWVNYEYMLKECQVGFLVSESSSSYQLTA